jgi:hypothetical protein
MEELVLAAVLTSMPSVRATTFLRAFPISANCMIPMDRLGFSRPIMRDRGAIERIWQAGLWRVKRALASPNARLFPVVAITVKQSAWWRLISAREPYACSSLHDPMSFHRKPANAFGRSHPNHQRTMLSFPRNSQAITSSPASMR